MNEPLKIGDKVRLVKSDYIFDGRVAAVVYKFDESWVPDPDQIRYVVQDDRRCLHIFSRKNLECIR